MYNIFYVVVLISNAWALIQFQSTARYPWTSNRNYSARKDRACLKPRIWSVSYYGDDGRERLYTSRIRVTPLRSCSDSQLERDSLFPSYITSSSDNDKPAVWLVVGDGDLSYSASIAARLNPDHVQLVSTVLEDETTHQRVYRKSVNNTALICGVDLSDKQSRVEKHSGQRRRHKVLFGIDATNLSSHFQAGSLDRIVFNFPHWPGKRNHRRNRWLVQEFLNSCATVLEPTRGEIHLALLKDQSGLEALNLQEWRDSWTVPMYANDAGLLLDRVEPFAVNYNLSSHRGVDRPFPTFQEVPRRYVFRLPGQPMVPEREGPINKENMREIDEQFQLCCRHEIRLELEPEILDVLGYTERHFKESDLLLKMLEEEGLPHGIKAEIAARELKHVPRNSIKETIPNRMDESNQSLVPLMVYLMAYRGVSEPLTRDKADTIRATLESLVDKEIGLCIRKRGRLVSRPFPYNLVLSQGLFEGYES